MLKRIQKKLSIFFKQRTPNFLKEKWDVFKEVCTHQLISGLVAGIISFFSVGVLATKIVPFLERTLIPQMKELEQYSNRFLVFKIVLSFLLTFFFINVHIYYKKHRLFRIRAGIANGAFLIYYKQNSTEYEIEDGEKTLTKRARNAESIRILGASGIRTFGEEDSPLWEAIKKSSELYVLMLHPMGEGIKGRVRSLLAAKNPGYTNDEFNEELNRYIKEIKKSIGTLKQIYNVNDEVVRLAFYAEEPLLKIIIIDHKLLWLQHYEAGIHVRDVPTYFLEKEEAKSGRGLFKAMLDIFDRKWKYGENHLYNFNENKIWNPQTNQYEEFF